MPRARECVISKQVPKRGHAPLAQRRHQRGDRKLSGPGSPTGMKHQNLAGHYNSRLRHDTLKMPLEGRSRAQVPAVRSLCRGVRASMLRRATNPACGSANLHWDSLRGISSQACLFQFLFVVSRQGRGRCSQGTAFELASCSSAVLADFCDPVNKIPLPIRLSWLLLDDDTVRARRNRLLARTNSPHGLTVSGTSL
jgi:hypothetical protein